MWTPYHPFHSLILEPTEVTGLLLGICISLCGFYTCGIIIFFLYRIFNQVKLCRNRFTQSHIRLELRFPLYFCYLQIYLPIVSNSDWSPKCKGWIGQVQWQGFSTWAPLLKLRICCHLVKCFSNNCERLVFISNYVLW